MKANSLLLFGASPPHWCFGSYGRYSDVGSNNFIYQSFVPDDFHAVQNDAFNLQLQYLQLFQRLYIFLCRAINKPNKLCPASLLLFLSLVPQGIYPGLIRPQLELMIENIFFDVVVGNDQNCKVRVDFIWDIKFKIVRRPVADNEVTPRPLVPEERKNLGMSRIDWNVGPIRLNARLSEWVPFSSLIAL